MKLKALLRGDVRFQYKYGFYFLYLLLSVLYVAVLFSLPAAWRQKAALLMIFSDPAAMGLYFMGAIVLFEKGERVLDSLAVSPAGAGVYALSKLVSIALISTAAGLAIGLAGGVVFHGLFFAAGVFLCSCLFSAVGLMLASRAVTLNGFILATIPAEILINLPAVGYLFGWRKPWLIGHPGVCMIELCEYGPLAAPALLILTVWTALFTALAERFARRMLSELGGVKL
jgi:fluoroquinolone transport system permease protein